MDKTPRIARWWCAYTMVALSLESRKKRTLTLTSGVWLAAYDGLAAIGTIERLIELASSVIQTNKRLLYAHSSRQGHKTRIDFGILVRPS